MAPCPNQALMARVTFEGIIKRSIVDWIGDTIGYVSYFNGRNTIILNCIVV